MNNPRHDANEASEDFKLFDPRAYLKEYHSDWDIEDDFSMSFLHQAYRSLPAQTTYLEVGGGPTIYQLISARNRAESITFSDYLKINREEILRWQRGAATAFNWDPYFQHVHKLENGVQSIVEMKADLRAKLKHVVSCNILQEPPLLSSKRQRYDIVSSHYCPESITSKREQFVLAMRNIASFVNPEGYLVMSFLRTAGLYAVGAVNFSAYPVTEDEAQTILSDLGFSLLSLSVGAAEGRRQYSGSFSLLAQR